MKINDVVRQGDVLVVRIKEIPKGAEQEKPAERIVLAYGEATGHAHAIAASEAHSYRTAKPVPVFDAQAERFLRVQVEALLKHEEHDAIRLPAGDYAIITQREYSPEEIRRVSD